MIRLGRLALLCVAAVLSASCGGPGAAHRALRDATLVLDFTPNAVHTGIYAALANGYDRSAGIRLHVIAPSASIDSIKLLEAGRVSFAILDIHDLAIARARGAPIVGIMAVVQRPLAAVTAAPFVGNPRQLEGRLVGISGVPSDTAVLRSTVAGAGGDPRRVRTVTIGFNAVAALLSGRVAAATAFWNDEGVTLQRRRPGFHVFRVDRYGAPPYPELVLCTSERTLRVDPGLAAGTVGALVRGYRFTLAHRATAETELESAVPGLDRALVSAQLGALAPAFATPGDRLGELSPSVLAAWARWEVRFGIVSRQPDVATTFDPEFVGSVAAR